MLIITNHQKSNSKATNHNEIPPYTRQDGHYKKQKIIKVGKNVQKLEPLCTVGGNVKCTAIVENSIEMTLKIKNRITIWIQPHQQNIPSNATTGYISKVIQSRFQSDVCILLSTIALFTIPNKQKKITFPLTNEWV